ncbi:MAG: AMP-binding protein, partial [Spirochaeta sp.]|nr:AMP-binding protein [Spirochaeta sp.]
MADTIIKLLKETVSSYPETIATLSKNSERQFVPDSYKQFYGLVNEFAAGLLAYGVKRGDHLGLISENRKEWLISDLAILGIGAVDVPRGSDSTADELKYILKHADCSITMVEDSVQLKKILSVKKELPILKTIVVLDENFRKKESQKDGVKILTFREIIDMGTEKIDGDPDFAEREFAKGKGDDLATIIYTSGTTGEPKGVMLSHRNFLYQIERIPEIMAVTAGDVWLAVLPVWHSFERIMQ